MLGNPLLLGGDAVYAVMTTTTIGIYTQVPTLSNGALTVTAPYNTNYSSKASVGLASGKRFFQVHRDDLGHLGDNTTIGITDASHMWLATITQWNSGTNAIGLSINGTGIGEYPATYDGTLGFAIDLDAKTIALYHDGVLIFSGLSIPATDPVFPFIVRGGQSNAGRQQSIETFNFGASPWVYAPPAGYDGWYNEV